MLIPQWKCLCLAEVKLLGIVIHQLGLWRTRSLCTCTCNASEGHEALARYIVHLLGGLGVAQDKRKGVRKVLNVPQLRHLQGTSRPLPLSHHPLAGIALSMKCSWETGMHSWR